MRPSAFVCVHGLVQARHALGVAAGLGRRVTLVSGPGAAVYAGCGWWRAMMDAAGCGDDLLDCGDAAGAAMAALRAGQRALILDPATPALAAVAGAAASLGAHVVTERPDCLDLGDGAAAWRLSAWLA